MPLTPFSAFFASSNIMIIRHLLLIAAITLSCGSAVAQTVFVKDCGQKAFPDNVPAGNYSGITLVGGNEYAVVSDKSATDGFYVFNIDIDSISGEITDVSLKAFLCDSLRGGDCEAIAYRPSSGTLFICSETDGAIREYGKDGKLTGRQLDVPPVFSNHAGNYGFESLTYDGRLFWTINESTLKCDGQQSTPQNGTENMLRLQSFGDDLKPRSQYAYRMDAPEASKNASVYAMGVSELAATDDGSLLVLEREFYVPKTKIGAFVSCKIYEITPEETFTIPTGKALTDSTKALPKRFVHSFKTKLGLFNRSLANYEGMCVGPTLADGSKVIILVSDSQNQYAGVLKDWFKTIIIKSTDTKVGAK